MCQSAQPAPRACHDQVKVWDLRMFRPLHAYFSQAPVDWCDVSQRGLLAVGHGRRVQVGAGMLRQIASCVAGKAEHARL
jgi:hypothetical protein